MVTLKDLVVGVQRDLELIIYKTFMQVYGNMFNERFISTVFFRKQVIKNRDQSLRLFYIIGDEIIFLSLGFIFLEIGDKKIKVLIKSGLRTLIKYKPFF